MITIEIANQSEANILLRQLQGKIGLKGMNLVMRSFGEQVKNSVQKNFDEEGRPTKWKPLKPETIRAWLRSRKGWVSKGKKPFSSAQIGGVRMSLTKSGTAAWAGVSGQSGRKILTDTARLRNSVHSVLLGPMTVAVRAGTEYAATHHFGDPKRNIPARPFMLVQDSDWDSFKAQIIQYLETL